MKNKKKISITILMVYVVSLFVVHLATALPVQAAIKPVITATWNNKLNQVNVEWTGIPSKNEGAKFETKYRLYYREKNQEKWIEYAIADWESTGKGVTDLAANTEYEFTLKSPIVSAEKAGLNQSNIATVTTKDFGLGFSVKWTGNDVLLDWRNAQISAYDGVRIWYKSPSDEESHYIGEPTFIVMKERHSMYISSIQNKSGEPYIKPQEGEEWVFGIRDAQNNQAQATVKCWTEKQSNDKGEYAPEVDPSKVEIELEDTGNVFEQLIAGIVRVPVRIVEGLAKKASFKEMRDLVFKQDHEIAPWATAEQKDIIYKWFYMLMWFVMPFFALVIAINGFKLMYSAANPAARAESMESIQRWFFALGIIVIAPVFIQFIMTVSGILVDAIDGAFFTLVGDKYQITLMDSKNIKTDSILGTALVECMFALMFLYFNIIYLVRMIAISVMFAFTPLMALMWAIKKNVTAAAVWMGELASNAFMPVAHALVIGTIMLLMISFEGSWIHLLIMLYTLIPLSEALRNSMMSIFTRAAGIDEQRVGMGAIGAVMGLAGMVSMARMGGAMFGGSPAKATAAAAGLSKSKPIPQSMTPPSRSNLTKGPQIPFSKTDYGKFNGHGVYAKHNWDYKNPKPTAFGKPTAPTGRAFHYKPESVALDREAALDKASNFGRNFGMAVAAPATLLAGAVPGGTAFAGAVGVTAMAIGRGGATAAMYGTRFARNLDSTGSVRQALQRTAGTKTTGEAVKRMAGTIGGGVIMPSAMINRVAQERQTAEQAKIAGIAARKNKLDARLNPIQRKTTPSQQPRRNYKLETIVGDLSGSRERVKSKTMRSETKTSYGTKYRERPATKQRDYNIKDLKKPRRNL